MAGIGHFASIFEPLTSSRLWKDSFRGAVSVSCIVYPFWSFDGYLGPDNSCCNGSIVLVQWPSRWGRQPWQVRHSYTRAICTAAGTVTLTTGHSVFTRRVHSRWQFLIGSSLLAVLVGNSLLAVLVGSSLLAVPVGSSFLAVPRWRQNCPKTTIANEPSETHALETKQVELSIHAFGNGT